MNFNDSGTLDVQSGVVSFASGFNQMAREPRFSGGSLGGSTFDFTGGKLSSNGIVNASVVNAAVVSPGISSGTLTINGNCTQTAAGELQMEFG